MGRSKQQTAKLSSTLWAALTYFGAKRKDDDRANLDEETKVDVRIVGTVGRSKVDEPFRCTLKLSPPQSRSDVSAAKPVDVVAYLLGRFDESDRIEIVEDLERNWQAIEAVEITEDEKNSATALMALLRTKRTKTVAGAITAQMLDN